LYNGPPKGCNGIEGKVGANTTGIKGNDGMKKTNSVGKGKPKYHNNDDDDDEEEEEPEKPEDDDVEEEEEDEPEKESLFKSLPKWPNNTPKDEDSDDEVQEKSTEGFSDFFKMAMHKHNERKKAKSEQGKSLKNVKPVGSGHTTGFVSVQKGPSTCAVCLTKDRRDKEEGEE